MMKVGQTLMFRYWNLCYSLKPLWKCNECILCYVLFFISTCKYLFSFRKYGVKTVKNLIILQEILWRKVWTCRKEHFVNDIVNIYSCDLQKYRIYFCWNKQSNAIAILYHSHLLICNAHPNYIIQELNYFHNIHCLIKFTKTFLSWQLPRHHKHLKQNKI